MVPVRIILPKVHKFHCRKLYWFFFFVLDLDDADDANTFDKKKFIKKRKFKKREGFSLESKQYLQNKFARDIVEGIAPRKSPIMKIKNSPTCTDSIKKAEWKKIKDTVRNLGTVARRNLSTQYD